MYVWVRYRTAFLRTEADCCKKMARNGGSMALVDRERIARLIKQYDQLIGMGDVEMAAQQLSCKVGVGTIRIEKIDAIAQSIALDRQFGELGLSHLEEVLVVAPGKQSAGAEDGIAAENQ